MDESLAAAAVPHYGNDNRLEDSDLSFLIEQERSYADDDTTMGPLPHSDGTFPGQNAVVSQDLRTHTANDMQTMREGDGNEDAPVFGDAIWETKMKKGSESESFVRPEIKSTRTMERTLDVLYGSGEGDEEEHQGSSGISGVVQQDVAKGKKVRVCVCVCLYACMYMFICMRVCVYVYMYACMCVC
jgi:hypothetical protein